MSILLCIDNSQFIFKGKHFYEMPRSGGLYIHLTLDSPFLKRLFSEGWGGRLVGRCPIFLAFSCGVVSPLWRDERATSQAPRVCRLRHWLMRWVCPVPSPSPEGREGHVPLKTRPSTSTFKRFGVRLDSAAVCVGWLAVWLGRQSCPWTK